MTMILFAALDGVAVVFLLYVLIQFWKEAHRSSKVRSRGHGIFSRGPNGPEVILLCYSPSPEGTGTGAPLIHFPTRTEGTQHSEVGAPAQQEKRFSAL